MTKPNAIPAVALAGLLLLAAVAGCSDKPAPSGAGAPAGGAATADVPKERTVSQGAEIKIEDYLVSGKTVIVDFYSKYCPPCMGLSPRLGKLAEKRPDLYVVKVDINRPDVEGIDWQSPVARQFGLEGIPHLKIYSPEGKLQAEGDEARGQVEEMFRKEGIE